MERLEVVQKIYARLARLEDDREVARINEQSTVEIDNEMTALRKELERVMNNLCPVIKGVNNGNQET